jgi:phosphate uptake regulator
MKLRRAGRLIHGMHQRLLSLYPDVSEELAEEARHVHDDVQALVDDAADERVVTDLEPLLERGVSFVVWTRHEV